MWQLGSHDSVLQICELSMMERQGAVCMRGGKPKSISCRNDMRLLGFNSEIRKKLFAFSDVEDLGVTSVGNIGLVFKTRSQSSDNH